MKLVGSGAANAAGIRRDRPESEAQAPEDTAVAVVHGSVGVVETLFAGVEGIGVLHEELPAAHHAEARSNLVAELGLDLVKIERQLTVAFDLPPHHVAYDFLVCGTEAVIAHVPIFEAKKLGPILVPAA